MNRFAKLPEGLLGYHCIILFIFFAFFFITMQSSKYKRLYSSICHHCSLLPLPKPLVVTISMNLLIYTGVGNLWPTGRIRPANENYPACNIFTNCGNPVASGYSIHSASRFKRAVVTLLNHYDTIQWPQMKCLHHLRKKLLTRNFTKLFFLRSLAYF